MTTTQAHLVTGETRAECWLKAATYLRNVEDWEALNLLVEISAPGARTEQAARIEAEVDRFLISHGKGSLQTVAGTHFPAAEYRRFGSPEAVYDYYPDKVFPLIKEGWGTYAHRMVRRVDENGNEFNPLKDCIGKMQRELNSRGPQRAAYELDVANGSIDLHTYDCRRRRDRNVPIGAPCLSHVSFKIVANLLFLTATYRHHYYMERALGNFLGLAQLQQFACDQTGLAPGSILCVSTLAKLDVREKPWKKSEVRDLLDRIGG